MTSPVLPTAPESPAANANGTVSPSDIPITTSRTLSLAVKCRSMCGVCGMKSSCFLNCRMCLRVCATGGFEDGQLDLVDGLHAMLAHRHLQLRPLHPLFTQVRDDEVSILELPRAPPGRKDGDDVSCGSLRLAR